MNISSILKYTVRYFKEKAMPWIILGDPGATGRDDAIFLGEKLRQELKSPWELTLTEPVPEVVKFRPAD